MSNSVRVIAGALVALLFAGVVAATPGAVAAGPGSLEFVHQVSEIDYGDKITINAHVKPGAEMVETVRALFRPRGGSTVWSYSYPETYVVDDGVSVTFEIPTGPGSYYPPGTEFEVEIEVTYQDREVASVRSPDSIEYLDPAQDWQRATGDGYTVVYYGVSSSSVNNLIAQTNSRISHFRAVLGVEDTPDFKAVVFPSVRDATPSFPPVSQTATEQLLFAGFAQPQYRLFVQGQMNPTTFVHELAHLYTHEAVLSPLVSGLPAWLNEGLARFLETGSSSNSNNRLRANVDPGELLSLRNMQAIPGQRSDVFIFYPQAGAFVGYLVEEYGAVSMANFLAAMNGGQPLQSGFELVYGRSLYEAENAWRLRFGADPLAIPSPTSEPSGPADGSTPSTPVPLVDYSAGMTDSSGPAATPAPVSQPTALPQTPPALAG
ncbi:MAG: peptidase MA family metallohydrolase, partial [Dehalococcoidia bacterium]|nr:peptidase MA family metallohydrolase [Dehalococcoidia bacterium]